MVEKTVRGFPAAWRVPPASGEVFESILECERRLRGFAFAEGFDIVRYGGGTKSTPGMRFRCMHWGSKSRNTRGLEAHVERNEEGETISGRQREATDVRQMNCGWSMTISFKSVGKRNSGIKGWVLSVKNDQHHGHRLLDDPLALPKHVKRLPEFQAVLKTAQLHRQAVIAYSESRRVLDAIDEFGLNLTSRQYYNTVRYLKGDKAAPETIAGLLGLVRDSNFGRNFTVSDKIPGQNRKSGLGAAHTTRPHGFSSRCQTTQMIFAHVCCVKPDDFILQGD